MKRVWLWAALGAASGIAGAGCGDPTTTGGTPLNLDRPIDVAFACYGAMRQTGGRAPGNPADPVIATAQPPAACAALSPPLDADAKAPVPGQETLSNGQAIVPAWYSFILQSSSGTVALATWGAKPAEDMEAGISDAGGEFKVLDGDPLTPGKNAISVGEDPIAIATDKAGCFEITANAGSCDLSSIGINSVLDDIQASEDKPMTPVKVDRLRVTNATAVLTDAVKGVILARPAAMVAEPSTTVVGNTCPATATGKVFIAYPGCHLVAGVDTATGKIVSGIQFDAAGAATILSGAALDNLTCPDECTNALGVRGNGAVMPGVRPVALDLRFDPRVDASKPAATSRLAIGAENSSSLTLVNLDPATSDPVSVLQIPLENKTGKLGVTAVALSPQIGMGGNAADGNNPTGDANGRGGQGQYIYAVATDGTVRVADVLDQKRECETQLDGRFVRDVADPAAMRCFPIGDPARPRRSAARGPGIELPFGAVATSVAIVKGRNLPPPVSATNMDLQAPGPTILLGHFAVITSSSGLAYVANVDDDYAPDVFSTSNPLGTQPVLTMAHQLRDGFFSRSLGPQTSDNKKLCASTDPLSTAGGAIAGGPRPLNAPSRSTPTGSIDPTKVLPLPGYHQVGCTLDKTDPPVPVTELEFGAPEPTRDQVYPDLATVQTETWRLTWEGQLSLDNGTIAVDGPPIRSGQLAIDSTGMRMIDPSRPFCELGVEPFDIVDIRGCSPSNGDAECPAGYTCFVHPKSVGVGVGACMLKSEAPRLADACFAFLTTQRRYTVSRVEPGQIRLLERWHELENTPIDGCLDDATNQCDLLAQDATKIDGLADPFTTRTHWSCRTDPLRAPISADPARNKRCVQMCSTDPAHPWDCASGTICQLLAPGGTEGICMEGVAAPQSCVNGPQHYDVRASEAFTVIGTRSGYVHPIVENNGACVVDPSASPVQRGRIPLKAPACDPTANPITGKLPGGGFEANPCTLASVEQFDTVASNPTPPACAAAPPTPLTAPATRTTQGLKFRNRAMALTLVDPFQACLPNGQGAVANVPLVNRGFELVFAQKAGYLPFTLPVIGPSYPVKVVRGPTDSIWVIDDGDFLSSSILAPSTQGRVFRIESIDVNRVSVIQ